ncbi:hypothetical protein PAPYR_9329 [Paratrimastix pyriformis]|uniref:Uncharacterized protein n=1 Tax=Paratrimastix pyriformis TaxID=342808 RepID=A0ABQ8UAA9_9EUKA|nr:hypothetical protein PAPYR_9329 [Paratrimastix pyriformis]
MKPNLSQRDEVAGVFDANRLLISSLFRLHQSHSATEEESSLSLDPEVGDECPNPDDEFQEALPTPPQHAAPSQDPHPSLFPDALPTPQSSTVSLDPRMELVMLWVKHHFTTEAVKDILLFMRHQGLPTPAFRQLESLKATLPCPDVVPVGVPGDSSCYRFNVADVVSFLATNYSLRSSPESSCNFSEFWMAPHFARRFARFQSLHPPSCRWVPLLLYVDDFGLSNGLHSHRPYCGVYVSAVGMDQRTRNSSRGWLPLAIISSPTREAKQAALISIINDILSLQSSSSVPELYALCGDHVALNELCGLVRPGRSHHGCLYCETFALNQTTTSPPVFRTLQRAQTVHASFQAANKTQQAVLKRETGYLPDGTPALESMQQMDFDPFFSSLLDVDHVEAGHVCKTVCNTILSGHRDTIIHRLERLREWLPSRVGPPPRIGHIKKMSFSEWRLLTQILPVLLWDQLPRAQLALLLTQCKYLSILYNRLAPLEDLQLAIGLIHRHRDFLPLCLTINKPSLNLHSSPCALERLVNEFGSPSLYRTQRMEALHKQMKRLSSQVAHMKADMSARWLLTNAWNAMTMTKAEARVPSHHMLGDSVLQKDDFILCDLVNTVKVARIISLTEGSAECRVWQRVPHSCPFPVFISTEERVHIPHSGMLEKVMLVPDCSIPSSNDSPYFLLNTGTKVPAVPGRKVPRYRGGKYQGNRAESTKAAVGTLSEACLVHAWYFTKVPENQVPKIGAIPKRAWYKAGTRLGTFLLNSSLLLSNFDPVCYITAGPGTAVVSWGRLKVPDYTKPEVRCDVDLVLNEAAHYTLLLSNDGGLRNTTVGRFTVYTSHSAEVLAGGVAAVATVVLLLVGLGAYFLIRWMRLRRATSIELASWRTYQVWFFMILGCCCCLVVGNGSWPVGEPIRPAFS